MKKMKMMAAAMMAAAMVTAMAGCGGSGDKAKPAAGGADQKVELKLAAALPTSHPLVQAMEQLWQPIQLVLSKMVRPVEGSLLRQPQGQAVIQGAWVQCIQAVAM